MGYLIKRTRADLGLPAKTTCSGKHGFSAKSSKMEHFEFHSEVGILRAWRKPVTTSVTSGQKGGLLSAPSA